MSFSTPEIDWGIKIIANIDGWGTFEAIDENNYLGISDNADDGYDNLDIHEPPTGPTGNFISLYFPHPEWNSNVGENFTQDIRSSIDSLTNSIVWDVEVISNMYGNVSLTFDFVNQINHIDLILVINESIIELVDGLQLNEIFLDAGEISSFSIILEPQSQNFEGCTDPAACNYDDAANVDDGSCEYYDPEVACDCDATLLDINGECCSALVMDECMLCNGDGSSCDATLLVPSEFATIQEAIDYSIDGDTILVSAGTYYENIVWPLTNNITLISADGPESTVIDGSNNYESCIYINKGYEWGIPNCGDGICQLDSEEMAGDFLENCPEDCYQLNAEINGFTITGGSGSQSNWEFRSGTGVLIDRLSNVTIENCDITENGDFGQGNSDDEKRGAIAVNDYSKLNLRHSKVHHNQATEAAGLWLRSMSDEVTTIYRSVLYSNESQYFNAELYTQRTDTYFENSVLYGQIYCSQSCIDTFSGINSIIFESGPLDCELRDFEYTVGGCCLDYFTWSEICEDGNLNWYNGEPQFTDPENGDFTLLPTSPCIDAGDPNSPLDPDGTRADMGAYYYHQDPVQGDVNGDFELNILDVVLGVNIILQSVEFTDEELSALDYNGDGTSNVVDLVMMVNSILNSF